MYAQYLAEFIGTAIFLGILLKSNGNPLYIVAGLLAAILLMGNVSGGHFNPAITVMDFAQSGKNSKDVQKCVGYIVAQILGAFLALGLNKIGRTSH